MFDKILSQAAEIAILVERTIEFIKFATGYKARIPQFQKHLDIGLSLAFSVLACYALEVNLVSAAGIYFKHVSEVGPAVTGVLVGLGSNIFHEAVSLLALWRAGLKVKAPVK